MIKIDKGKCPANHPCPLVRLCPKGAITQKGYNAPEFHEEECVMCGVCTNSCPYKVFSEDSE